MIGGHGTSMARQQGKYSYGTLQHSSIFLSFSTYYIDIYSPSFVRNQAHHVAFLNIK
jgi:hypothetical protein